MELKEDNYFSQEAQTEYLSVSQLKDFIGTPFREGCESRALATLRGEYERPKTDALLIGSYVDAALLGTDEDMERFKEENPSIFSSRGATKGQLKSNFIKADYMVARAKRDKFFMQTLKGEHQKILTGEIFGVPFKVKLDVLNLEKGYITDLKTCKSITEFGYDKENNKRVNMVEYQDYILQGAIYQEIVRQNYNKKLPFFLSCISKEDEPDIGVFQIDDDTLLDKLWGNDETGFMGLKEDIENVYLVKTGKVAPMRCEHCEWCRKTKVLKAPLNWLQIGE